MTIESNTTNFIKDRIGLIIKTSTSKTQLNPLSKNPNQNKPGNQSKPTRVAWFVPGKNADPYGRSRKGALHC